MNTALLVSALLMGLAGTPHCLTMCGAACAAIGGGTRAAWPFHVGRLVSYAAAGAVAAAGMGALASLGQAVNALRPLWTLVHVAALALGLTLMWQGRQPAWMANLGSARGSMASGAAGVSGWRVVVVPARRAAAGLAWAAWPCGLLQSALLVAALADGAVQGAAVMIVFGASSAIGLVFGPALWWRLGSDRSAAWAVRLAGLMLAAASAWALGHGLWMRFAAWCGLT